MFRIRIGLNTNLNPDLDPAFYLNTVWIRIQEAISMRIHTDLDPDPDPDQLCGHKKFNFYILLSFQK
jgi:hypothetical protein